MSRKILSLSLLALALAACTSSKPGPEQAAASVEDRSGAKPSGVGVPTVDASQTGGAAAELKAGLLGKRSVFFDFDDFTIKDEYKAQIDAHAKYLVGHANARMLIQGNTDERGSREYNIALGQKRADAVRRALMLQGAREQQIESVSLGEEKPRNAGHDEAAWADNRRADMLYKGEY
ncbi:MAG: peptidoglycan-associated lipoprotein Pal [Rhodocyclaceae bacterium]|nr:peptidoglycan-associated lipoprotein Pal [Rhodocyclaceae bacterium]MBX3669051.1 peptidoglycan-associated lipoprotein Pal [Rhodocyclaceae bacterium]